jgi:hypothetical protein
MTLPENCTVKRIIAGIVIGVTMLVIGMILASERRISVLETKMTVIERSLEVNRTENRDEHRIITNKLDLIWREVGKK